MRFFKSYSETHRYHHLPVYSKFLLEHHLADFVKEQLRISYEVELPVLKQLNRYTEAQLLTFITASMSDFLQQLAENNAHELIERSLEKWRTDQLEIIGKSQLIAEDITLINYVRGRAFRKFIPQFTSDITIIIELVDELDSFLTGSATAATNMYIHLLKDQITIHETNLLEAQHIARIGSFDLDLITDLANNSPELYNIFGIDQGIGLNNFLQFVHPQDKPHVSKALAGALESGLFESEFRFVKTEKTKYIWSKGIVQYNNGRPVKLMGTVQDITDRKKAEQELLDKTIALERSNDSLQQFAYVASHDLKEPLRKISIYSDLVQMKEAELSPESRTNLKKLNQFAVHMRQMIDDIMAYSTLTQWEERTSYDLGKCVQEAIHFLEHTIAEKNATIECDPLPGAKVVPSQFRQLFLNLISNALKFSRPGVTPKISIKHRWLNKEELVEMPVTAGERYLQMSVQDNGIGFNQEFAERIFGLFSRLNSKQAYEGSGIGLAIAKRIMDNHGGVIYAASDKNQGTTFTFVIPQ